LKNNNKTLSYKKCLFNKDKIKNNNKTLSYKKCLFNKDKIKNNTIYKEIKMSKKYQIILILTIFTTSLYATEKLTKPTILYKNGIIQFFPNNPKNAIIIRKQIESKKLWVSATRRNGKTRQIRITNHIGHRGQHTKVIFQYPFGDASATWNMDVKREDKQVSITIPWNGVLIGDIMDVNEGEKSATQAKKKLNLPDPKTGLPVLYSSGDSISLGYWPYLEAELNDTINVYYQRELAKDMPQVKLRNNGHANLAYQVLKRAYKNNNFKPDYWLVNFGLHMINTHKNKLPDYANWVEKFITYAKEKKTTLILVTTTPYRQSSRPHKNLIIIKFNELMKTAAKKSNVSIIDLYTCTTDAVKELGEKQVYNPDGVHFSEAMKKRQANYIAKRIQEILKKNK